MPSTEEMTTIPTIPATPTSPTSPPTPIIRKRKSPGSPILSDLHLNQLSPSVSPIPSVKRCKTSSSSPSPNKDLLVKRLTSKAKLPFRGSGQAAGYDLFSAADMVIPAEGKALIPTDLSIGIPAGTYGRVAPRSGLALKNFIDCGAGVIDPDYRGPLGVLLFNHSKLDHQVKEGDRIAQLILERIRTPNVIEVDELEGTERGLNGFGSTGLR
ncbi:16060_t:CDS:2 [Funneliformis geosporum]|uniref:Deoxyuridine 5'-triphosphate nucleotidohydrolase n=1 Tax=Funneliformis geosporum TaxID=1117311 RepID=A0A9W4WJR0_9GLOM|nr:16060_t:CDS:2 [Funneliformis geosporum]CAI2166760.1 4447_t:CDS:2 [Funneliformis geosporum]